MILARVIGLSDQGYMLTTGEEELGVVVAFSEASKLAKSSGVFANRKADFASRWILERRNRLTPRLTLSVSLP